MRVSRLGWLAFFFVGSSPPFSPPLSFTIVRCSSSTDLNGAPRHPSPVDFGTAHSTHMKPAEDAMSKLRVHNFAIWLDDRWRGWWGENPPYHVPVFVLTNHAREPITMKGGTVFHFVTGGIEEALLRAREAAGGRDIQVGGGASTVRQYLQARLIDEMHVAIAPILLGSGEALFAGMDLPALGYACTEHVATPAAMHVVLTRRA